MTHPLCARRIRPGLAASAPTRRRLRLLALPAAAVLACAGARADDAATRADEAFYARAATCAAAMEIDQYALVAKARAGEPDLRPDIERLTRLGFAYVGTAYLRGLRNPRGDEMLRQARIVEKARPGAEHARIAGACGVEAGSLFEQATSVEQWLLANRARSRVDKLLAPPKPR